MQRPKVSSSRRATRSRNRVRHDVVRYGITLALVAITVPQIANAQLVAKGRQWLEGHQQHQRTGEAVVFCDFDGDGYDDLAVGSPTTDVTTIKGILPDVGTVRIYLGDPSGISPEGMAARILRPSDLFAGLDDAGDNFGSALAAADFDLDGACDLAIGIPGAEVDGLTGAGRVAVIPGQLGVGLDPFFALHFDRSNLTGAPATGDRFGSVLAAGPLGEDPHPDLVVGAPFDQVSGFDDAGSVSIITARNSGGLGTAFDALLHQDIENAFGVVGPGDRFGSSLAIGDVTGDGVNDLVVGSPGDRVGFELGAGAVQVFPGGESGVEISAEEQRFFHQDMDEILGNAASGDDFGAALTLGDFNSDQNLDMAVGIPGESQFGPDQSGAVQIFYGTSEGLSLEQQLVFESLISPEIAQFDRFGSALASGDFDCNSFDELVIGYSLDNVFGITNAGNVAVLSGGTDGVSTTGAQLWNGFTMLTVEPGDEIGASLAVGHLGGDRFGPYLAIGAPGREDELSQPQAGGAMLLRSQVAVFSDGFESGDTSRWGGT